VRSTCTRVLVIALLSRAGTTFAQVPAAPSPWTRWGTDINLLLDGYMDGNFNNPACGYNGLRNFDLRSNTAHLSLALASLERAPAPVGFHLDVGFGQTLDVVHATDQAPGELKYLQQAYVELKPKSWKGLQVDAGEFVTAAGAEVVETNQNWNYSRSLLFAWAIPYYHLGIRASFPVGAHFTGGVQLVNGWNNVQADNCGKTIGLNGAYAWKNATWTSVYYGGPENDRTHRALRHLYDTTVLVNLSDRLSYYVNFTCGRDNALARGIRRWTGLAAAARLSFAKRYALASRLEWFDDLDGFATGAAQQVKEFTLTGERKMAGWLVGRLEFRDDWSNRAFFETTHRLSKNQPTVLLGMLASLGRQK